MAVEIGSVFYELAIHDEQFAAALRNSVKNLDQLDGGVKKAAVGVGHLENGIKAATAQLKQFAGAIGIGLGIREFIRNSVEAQASLAQLGAALRSTGGAAGFTLPELVKMSDELSKLSTFSDEAVQGGLARLLTYTGIQGPMFREAARATIDFATALNIDVTSAAERVGNALQYPTEAINSLTKQGFRFTVEQKRVIEQFEKTGQLSKAQAVILRELDLAYKGSAEAARGTLGGALAHLQNAFGDTLKVSRKDSAGIIDALNSIADAMPHVRDAVSDFLKYLNLGFIQIGISAAKADVYLARLQLKAANVASRIPGLRSFGATEAAAARAVLGTDNGAGTLAQLDALRKERVAEVLDPGPPAPPPLPPPPPPPRPGLTDAEIAKAKAIADESAALSEQLRSQLAALTTTARDDLQGQLEEFNRSIAAAKEKGYKVNPALVEQLRAAKQQAIDLAPQTEAIATALERIDAATAQGFNLSGSLAEMGTLIEQAQAIRDATPEGSGAREAAQKRINELIAKELEIRNKLKGIQKIIADDTKTFAANLSNVSGMIANAANAAFGLASAFAGSNSELAKMLGATGQLAGGISSVSGLADKAGGFGKLFSSGSGILSALPGIGQAIGGALALGSVLFAKSPEEIQRAANLKKNTEALQDLTKRVGDLGRINVTGTQLGTLDKFFARPELARAATVPAGLAGAVGDTINRLIGTALDAVGLSAKEFKEIMRAYGLAIDDAARITVADVQALQKAIKEAEIAQFAETFEGQMSQFNAAVKIFDLSKPIDQFNALRRAIGNISGGGGGALSHLLDQFDLSTAQGIAAADQALQDLFRQMQTATPDQLVGMLGGLTPQQFESLIEQALGLVRAQAGSGAVAGTGGFNVSRTITEVTGNRLEALLSTANIFEERTAQNTDLIARLLGGGAALPLIQPPASGGFSGATAGGPAVVIESLTINLSGLSDASQAQALGGVVANTVLDEIDKGLGQRLRWKKLSRGMMS